MSLHHHKAPDFTFNQNLAVFGVRQGHLLGKKDISIAHLLAGTFFYMKSTIGTTKAAIEAKKWNVLSQKMNRKVPAAYLIRKQPFKKSTTVSLLMKHTISQVKSSLHIPFLGTNKKNHCHFSLCRSSLRLIRHMTLSTMFLCRSTFYIVKLIILFHFVNGE